MAKKVERRWSKRCYLTRYKRGLTYYGAHVWAKDLAQAKRYCKARGIGEFVEGEVVSPLQDEPPPSEMLRAPGLLRRKVHALSFLGMLATSAGVADAADFFDDAGGVIHQLVHCVNERGDVVPGEDRAGRSIFREILFKVQQIQRAVPGFLPPIGHPSWGRAALRRGYV